MHGKYFQLPKSSVISVTLLALTPLIALPLWYFVQNKSVEWYRAISFVSIGSIFAAVILHFLHTNNNTFLDAEHYHFNVWGIIAGIIFSLLLHFLHPGKSKFDSLTIVTADYIHNVVNSFTLLVAVLALPEMWLPITISLVLHELVHKAGNYGLFLSIGLSPKKALFLILGGIPMFLILPILQTLVPLKGNVIPFLSNFASANLLVMSFLVLYSMNKKKSLTYKEWFMILIGTLPAIFINFIAHGH